MNKVIMIYLFTFFSHPLFAKNDHQRVVEAAQPFLNPEEERFNVKETIRAEMGYALFRDQRFSLTKSISCASCHQPTKFFTDGTSVSSGISHTRRNSPSIVNAKYRKNFFWDGRALSLKEQAKLPLEHPSEHGISRGRVAQLIFSNYKPLYESAYGPFPASLYKLFQKEFILHAYPKEDNVLHKYKNTLISKAKQNEGWIVNWNQLSKQNQNDINTLFDHAADSLAQFQKGIVSKDSPFDSFVKNLQKTKNIKQSFVKGFGEDELQGFQAFLKSGCQNCHNGPLFSDEKFHNTMVKQIPGIPADYGRLEAYIKNRDLFCLEISLKTCKTQIIKNDFLIKYEMQFKTPSLRGLPKTAPYFHHGMAKDINSVLQHYVTISQSKEATEKIKQLKLSAEDLPFISKFLTSLNSEIQDMSEY